MRHVDKESGLQLLLEANEDLWVSNARSRTRRSPRSDSAFIKITVNIVVFRRRFKECEFDSTRVEDLQNHVDLDFIFGSGGRRLPELS